MQQNQGDLEQSSGFPVSSRISWEPGSQVPRKYSTLMDKNVKDQMQSEENMSTKVSNRSHLFNQSLDRSQIKINKLLNMQNGQIVSTNP